MTLRLSTLLATARAAFWSSAATAVRTSPWHVDTLRHRRRAGAA